MEHIADYNIGHGAAMLPTMFGPDFGDQIQNVCYFVLSLLRMWERWNMVIRQPFQMWLKLR